MKKNILITYGTRALAQRVAKLLEDRFQIFFASSEEIPQLLLKSAHYLKIPAALLPTYAHELLKISLDHEIDYILPLGRTEISTLMESEVLFEEYNVTILAPKREVLAEIPAFEDPDRNMRVMLLENSLDLLTDSKINIPADLSGLVISSDEGEEYALVVASNSGF